MEIVVNPIAIINTIETNICTGDPLSIIPVDGTDGIIPTGTTYQWTVSEINGGIIGATSGSGNTIEGGTLVNPTNTPQSVTYTVTPTSGTCPGLDFTITVTVDPITEITVQPSGIGEVDCFGDGFDPISVTAVGGGLEYQWYSIKQVDFEPISTPGTPITGATSASFTPPSNTEISTLEKIVIYYYYVVVKGNCEDVTSDLSGGYEVLPPATRIDINPSTDDRESCLNGSFPGPGLTVAATGELDEDEGFTEIIYQWYKNTNNDNTTGTPIDGANSATYIPSADEVGTFYYYATAASKCGTVPTDVSGAHTVTPLTEIEVEDLAGQVICFGDNFDPISVEADGTGTISYQWYQNDQNSTTSGNIVAIGSDSNTFTPPSGLSNPTQSETFYYFVVVSSNCGEDVTSSVSGAFTVNPIPEVTNSELEQTICSDGSTTEIIPTSNVSGTSFTWTASTSDDISGFTATGTGSIPIQTLTNAGTTRGSVIYTITPTANGCSGPTFEYTVNVDPLPEVTNTTLTQTICSGENSVKVDITSNVAGATFAWTATATPGVSGFQSSGIGPIPAQTISTSENSPGTITYEITPTANTCAGPIATYTIDVNPIPTITNSDLEQTICSGESSSQVDFTSLVNGTTFEWTVISSSGASGFTSSGSGPLPSQIITATGPSQGSVTYEVTPSANGCSGPPATYTIYIDPIPTVTNTLLEQTICSGGSTSEVELTSDVTGVSFAWTAVASTGITGFTSSGSGSIPTETITNSGTTQGTVTYTIIPSASGCSGPSVDYLIKVDPLPIPTFIESPAPEVCLQSSVTYTTQSEKENYIWNLPGVEGTNYNIISGGTANESITVEWLTTGSKTVTVSYTDPATNCIASSEASSTTEVEPFATVGPSSIPAPSFCITDTSPLSFTQATTGVTSIGTPSGLPPGITATFNSGTGNIEFSGTSTTPGFYNYSIPLNGNCIDGLAATGTIDITPEYELTSVSSISATITGGRASITINGDIANLPNGEYQVAYTLNDGTGSSSEISDPFLVTNGRGTFPSIPLTDLDVEAYELTITSIKKTTGGCETNIVKSDQVTTFFSVCGVPFTADGTFFVPAGVYEVTIQATGAGAAGETKTVTIPVNPGQALGVYVGQGGATGIGRDTWVTRDSSLPNPETSSYVYATGIGGGTSNGQVNISYSCPDANAADCMEVVDDGAKTGTTIIRFICDDVWEIPEGLIEFSVYAVGGGGGGGRSGGVSGTAGGGGGGGFASTTVTSNAQNGISAGNSLDIKVGQGGPGSSSVNNTGENGDDTEVTSTIPDPLGNININLTASGGGGGASFNSINGTNGSSGGGGAYNNTTQGLGGTGIAGQGNDGGNSVISNGTNAARSGGGGGGAGSIGGEGKAAGSGSTEGGIGGEGLSFLLEELSVGYGAGGGGIGFNQNGNSVPGEGGIVNDNKIGGDGNLSGTGHPGQIYTGSGGGAGTLGGGRGGSGVVYITYFSFNILPIEYLYFEAEYQAESRTGKLNWATAKEWENSHFEIERSLNGIKNWEKIAEVPGAGYSEVVTEYEFIDQDLPASGGIVYYRLKDVNFYQEYSFSNTRSMVIPGITGTSSWIAYPNPSHRTAELKLDLLDSSNYNEEPIIIQISDIRGVSKVYKVNRPEEVSEVVNSHLQISDFGIFIIQLTWGDSQQQIKIIRN
ncbi:MAG: PKD-like domain-containing protein [Bacteroidota bacterium]